MSPDPNHLFANFFICGINYKKSDITVRGLFSVLPENNKRLTEQAAQFGIQHFFTLSTCNRTEIYGFSSCPQQLSRLLCSGVNGDYEKFATLCYVKKGSEAVRHLFSVAAGLDSQILGDYEIIGQIKQSVKFAKANNCLDAKMERLINEVLQASKKIRTETALSSGTVSVSFAAVQYIKKYLGADSGKNVLLIGTGKIGTNTCKNLVDYLPGNNILLTNRTPEKATRLAKSYRLQHIEFNALKDAVDLADIILVTTHADKPILNKDHFTNGRKRLVIDLSVPGNVDRLVNACPAIELLTVDDLAKIKDETLQKRMSEIPKVNKIIEERITELEDWCNKRIQAVVLKTAKRHLQKLNAHTVTLSGENIDWVKDDVAEEIKIQKAINVMAVKLQAKSLPGCHCIEAMNDLISLS